MAGNQNSGRRKGEKGLPELIQSACRRAIKQGNAGLAGQRALSELLAEQMQTDPLGFLRAVAPYVPKEILVDHQISIAGALQEARERVIGNGSAVPSLEGQRCSQAIIEAHAIEPVDTLLTDVGGD